MRNKAVFPAVFVLLLLIPSPFAQESPNRTTRFDGKWMTTVSCADFQDALGFSWRFISVVKDGNFRGLQGTEGQPASLLVEGTIASDGAGKLYATGHTGQKPYVPGNQAPVGTEFSYNIKAQFNDQTGTGVRIEGRPCTYDFQKQ